jgi:hypothetical protein
MFDSNRIKTTPFTKLEGVICLYVSAGDYLETVSVVQPPLLLSSNVDYHFSYKN